jgi:hypothetical protein
MVINGMNRWIKDMEYKLPLSMYQNMQCGILDRVSHPPCSKFQLTVKAVCPMDISIHIL